MVSLEAVTRTDSVRGSATALTVTCFFRRSLMDDPGAGAAPPLPPTAEHGGAPASVIGSGRIGLVWIREEGEQFVGHIGAIRIGEEEEADLDGVFLRNIQLVNEVGDAGHVIRRGADQHCIVLVIRNGVDVNRRAPRVFRIGATTGTAGTASAATAAGRQKVDEEAAGPTPRPEALESVKTSFNSCAIDLESA